MIKSVVCDTPHYDCFFGICDRCINRSPSSILQGYCQIIDEDDEWSWSLWKVINKKVDLHHIRGAITSLLDEIDEQWKAFLLHSYYNREQRTYINDIRLQSSDTSFVVVQLDFSENYSIIRQREVQAAHWNNLQATLFTIHVTIGTSHKNVVIISDYMHHDTAFVYCAQRVIVKFLKKHYPNIVKINYLRYLLFRHSSETLSLF